MLESESNLEFDRAPGQSARRTAEIWIFYVRIEISKQEWRQIELVEDVEGVTPKFNSGALIEHGKREAL